MASDVLEKKPRGNKKTAPRPANLLPPVLNEEQLSVQLHALRELMHKRATTVAATSAKVSAIVTQTKKEVQEIEDQLFLGASAVYPFAQSKRDALLSDGQKFVEFPEAVLRWRESERTLGVVKGKDKTVLALLKRMRLSKYIRTTESLNLEAMRTDFDRVAALALEGIIITPKGEYFAIVPTHSASYLRIRIGQDTWTIQDPPKKKTEKTTEKKQTAGKKTKAKAE